MGVVTVAARCAVCASVVALAVVAPWAQDPDESVPRLHPLEKSEQFRSGVGSSLLADASVLVRVNEARAQMKVSGKGLAAIVIDSGIVADHSAFCGRVVRSEDFTGDTRPDPAIDREGHGTHVAGVIAASAGLCHSLTTGVSNGMAPGSAIYSLKAMNDLGGSDYDWMGAALRRAVALVREQSQSPGGPMIGAVNLSIGSFENLQTDGVADRSGIVAAIKELWDLNVPVVTAAGNLFFEKDSTPGMCFPAIVHQTISVGAVFNKNYKDVSFGPAFAKAGKPLQIAPFSQRLPFDDATALGTDLFAPGAEIRSTGLLTPSGFSLQKGTSQAAPMVTGAILLLQEYYNVRRGNTSALTRPPIDDLAGWLKEGSDLIRDNYGDDDNVKNTDQSYRMLNVLKAMERLKAEADAGKLK